MTVAVDATPNCIFLPTPSARRATADAGAGSQCASISTHALREEGDDRQNDEAVVLLISTHALREEGDYLLLPCVSRTLISTHALREEGDGICGKTVDSASKFLPTPSARRATGGWLLMMVLTPISTHALREEGDGRWPADAFCAADISTHALREEGDRLSLHPKKVVVRFLPTPSARRATWAAGY